MYCVDQSGTSIQILLKPGATFFFYKITTLYILGLFSNLAVVEFCTKWIFIRWGPGLGLEATKMASQMVTQMAVELINIHFISVEQKR